MSPDTTCRIMEPIWISPPSSTPTGLYEMGFITSNSSRSPPTAPSSDAKGNKEVLSLILVVKYVLFNFWCFLFCEINVHNTKVTLLPSNSSGSAVLKTFLCFRFADSIVSVFSSLGSSLLPTELPVSFER